MEETNQFRKNFIWNTLGTGLNAFNSLFFMIIVTRINGIDNAGIFTLAFSTACILYAIGIYAGRVYQVTELNKEITDNDFLLSRIITVLLMIIFVVLFCSFKQYNLQKTTVFVLLTVYKALDAFCDVLYGILQKNNDLNIVGKSLFMKSFISIIGFLVIDLITKNMIFSIIILLGIFILFTVIYDFKKIYKYINISIKPKKQNVLNVLTKGFLIFAISFLGMYIVNAPKYAIDTYLEENYQTIFGIIVMPATIISLVAQFLIHPYLNKIVALYKERKLKEFKSILLQIIGTVFGFGIISTLLGYFIGTPVLGLIYGINLETYKMSLAIIIISATLYTVGTVLSSVLTTVRKTIPQFIIYLFITGFAFIISDILTKKNSIDGAVISYFSIMTAFSSLYIMYVKINLKKIFNKEEV